MKTSKLWSALVVSCIACGSSFHSNDASTGGDDNGGGSGGTGVSSGGDTSIAGTSTGGKTGTGGHGHGGSTSTAGSTSAGGVIGVGGDLSIAGSVSAGGAIGVGGDVGIAGGVGVSGGPSGGAAGSSPSGGSGGSGGSGATDCTTTGKLWTTYMDLVDKSALCDATVTDQCVANSNVVNYGNCPIPVNQKSQYYSAAKNALQNWKNAGCVFKITMCLAQGSPSCQLGTDVAATCKSNPIATP